MQDDGNVAGMPSTPDLKTLARLGAGLRLQQLDHEEAAITTVFPELRGARRGFRLVAPDKGVRVMPARRKKLRMSQAGRAAIIAAARQRWAEWR